MMKRFVVLGLVLAFGFSLYATGSKEKDKVLLFIRHGSTTEIELMIEQEVGVMTSMLEEADYKVVVASDSGEPIKDPRGESVLLIPDLKLADVRVNDYVGIILPCVAKGSGVKSDPEEISLVKKAVARGKPIAAQHGARYILADAGVLVGRIDIIVSEGVIQDGTIITSTYCPYYEKNYGKCDGTLEHTKLFIETIKE